jgi:hypothetical protein
MRRDVSQHVAKQPGADTSSAEIVSGCHAPEAPAVHGTWFPGRGLSSHRGCPYNIAVGPSGYMEGVGIVVSGQRQLLHTLMGPEHLLS